MVFTAETNSRILLPDAPSRSRESACSLDPLPNGKVCRGDTDRTMARGGTTAVQSLSSALRSEIFPVFR